MRQWRKRTACISSRRSKALAKRSESCISARPKRSRRPIQPLSKDGQPIKPMKKLLCILATAALLGGCEQKDTTVVAPGTSPAPDKKTENKTTIVNPTTEKTKETTNTNTTTTVPAPTTSNSSSTTTTTTSSPSP